MVSQNEARKPPVSNHMVTSNKIESMKLTLYSTQDCHLCEQAVDLLNQVTEKFDLEHIDIAGSEALVEKYGIRIPVVKNGSGKELDWPFDLEMLEKFIRENNESV